MTDERFAPEQALVEALEQGVVLLEKALPSVQQDELVHSALYVAMRYFQAVLVEYRGARAARSTVGDSDGDDGA